MYTRLQSLIVFKATDVTRSEWKARPRGLAGDAAGHLGLGTPPASPLAVLPVAGRAIHFVRRDRGLGVQVHRKEASDAAGSLNQRSLGVPRARLSG